MSTISIPVSRLAMKTAALSAAGISGKTFGTTRLSTRFEPNKKAAIQRGKCKHKGRSFEY